MTFQEFYLQFGKNLKQFEAESQAYVEKSDRLSH